MSLTQIAYAWRVHRLALSAARLEDDANLRQLQVVEKLQNEAELALQAVTGSVERPDERPDGGAAREEPEALRAYLAQRRLELWGRWFRVLPVFLRDAWRAASQRTRIALALATLALVAAALWAPLTARRNVALGCEWKASSSDHGAASSGRLGEENNHFFFHTRHEQSPFLEIDLGKARSIERVVVANRRDCCQERALPMLLEASDDRKHWTLLGRRDQPFQRWRAAFGPARARWLRLSVPRETSLHLESVAVY
jgi:hypothetical protein